jgi:hypothetical protein
MMELEYRFSDEFLIFLSVFAYLNSPLTIKNRVKMKIRITRGKIILRKTRETQTRTRTTGQIGQRAIPGDRSVVELFGTAETSKTCSGTPEIERDGQMEKRNKQNRGKRNSSREGNKNPLAESHVIHNRRSPSRINSWTEQKHTAWALSQSKIPKIAMNAKYRKNCMGFADKKYYP